MYSQEAIDILKTRIGWSVPTDLPIAIESNIELPETVLKFNGYHGLVSLTNLFHTVEESITDEDEFNKKLLELRDQSIMFSLNSILNKSADYIDNQSYDTIITDKASLFEEVIGLTMAIKVFELYMASNRSNYVERNSKLSYQNLKIELEGVKNDSGYQVAIGIRQQLYKAIRDAQKVIFPNVPTVEYIEFW